MIFGEPRFLFGKNVPQNLYTWSFDAIGIEHSWGAAIYMGKGFELRWTQHFLFDERSFEWKRRRRGGDFRQRRRLCFQWWQLRKYFRLHGTTRHYSRRRRPWRLAQRFEEFSYALFLGLRFAAARNRTARRRRRRRILWSLRLRFRLRHEPPDQRDEHKQQEKSRMVEQTRRDHFLLLNFPAAVCPRQQSTRALTCRPAHFSSARNP